MWNIRRLITQQNASALDATPVDDPMWQIIKQTISSRISRLTARCDLQRRGWAVGGGGGWGCSRPSSDNNTMEKDSEKKKRSEWRDGKADGEESSSCPEDTLITTVLFFFCSLTLLAEWTENIGDTLCLGKAAGLDSKGHSGGGYSNPMAKNSLVRK